MATATDAKPLRYLLCGKFPSHQEASVNITKPDFENARIAASAEDAKSAISELIASSSPPQISFIVMGGGFTPPEFNEVRSTPGADSVPWFRPIQTKPGYDGPPQKGPPTAEEVSTRLRKGLDQYADQLRAGQGAGEVWYF